MMAHFSPLDVYKSPLHLVYVLCAVDFVLIRVEFVYLNLLYILFFFASEWRTNQSSFVLRFGTSSANSEGFARHVTICCVLSVNHLPISSADKCIVSGRNRQLLHARRSSDFFFRSVFLFVNSHVRNRNKFLRPDGNSTARFSVCRRILVLIMCLI